MVPAQRDHSLTDMQKETTLGCLNEHGPRLRPAPTARAGPDHRRFRVVLTHPAVQEAEAGLVEADGEGWCLDGEQTHPASRAKLGRRVDGETPDESDLLRLPSYHRVSFRRVWIVLEDVPQHVHREKTADGPVGPFDI